MFEISFFFNRKCPKLTKYWRGILCFRVWSRFQSCFHTVRRIQWIPKQLFQLSYIENLYLDNNNLELLPDKFFEKLPQLKYLDLRNNELSEIPSLGLENHKNLQVLLLSRNSITQLPLKLGFVKSLNALHWIGNPIEFPEMSVLEQSNDEMKKGMRKLYRERLNEEPLKQEKVEAQLITQNK